MKFERYFPSESLRPYIKRFVVVEHELAKEYKVFPSSGLVMGFQYRGQLACIEGDTTTALATAGITGISDRYKVFKSSPHTGTLLVYFTETGFAHFVSNPAHELFNQSLSLTTIFDVYAIEQTAAQLSLATNDRQRIGIVEQFLLSQLHSPETDQLVAAAVRLIYQSKGTVRIKQLQEQLFISESPFEKRFRKVVGTSPKKFASIVRFEAVMDDLGHDQSLSAICYQHHFFDQAHFTKVFSQFTGATPEHFRRKL